MSNEKSAVISNIVSLLLEDNETAAKAHIQQEYPHAQIELEKRAYTMAQKMTLGVGAKVVPVGLQSFVFYPSCGSRREIKIKIFRN